MLLLGTVVCAKNTTHRSVVHSLYSICFGLFDWPSWGTGIMYVKEKVLSGRILHSTIFNYYIYLNIIPLLE